MTQKFCSKINWCCTRTTRPSTMANETHTPTHNPQFNGKYIIWKMFLVQHGFCYTMSISILFFGCDWAQTNTKIDFLQWICANHHWIVNYTRLRKFHTENLPTNFAYTNDGLFTHIQCVLMPFQGKKDSIDPYFLWCTFGHPFNLFIEMDFDASAKWIVVILLLFVILLLLHNTRIIFQNCSVEWIKTEESNWTNISFSHMKRHFHAIRH